MTQFHEGQEVEVLLVAKDIGDNAHWIKAKIVWKVTSCAPGNPKCYEVEFPDGARAVFDEERIRCS